MLPVCVQVDASGQDQHSHCQNDLPPTLADDSEPEPDNTEDSGDDEQNARDVVLLRTLTFHLHRIPDRDHQAVDREGQLVL